MCHDDGLISKRRRDEFGDCALVEIVHLHDCLRGALRALQKDVSELSSTVSLTTDSPEEVKECATSSSSSSSSSPIFLHDKINELERRVAGRFKVIWSVFRAHSSAEDEFIWPALQSKQSFTRGFVHSPSSIDDNAVDAGEGGAVEEEGKVETSVGGFESISESINDGTAAHSSNVALSSSNVASTASNVTAATNNMQNLNSSSTAAVDETLAQTSTQTRRESQSVRRSSSTNSIQEATTQHEIIEEYEEDHADEERMFRTVDELLSRLRAGLSAGEQRRRSSMGIGNGEMRNDSAVPKESSKLAAPSSNGQVMAKTSPQSNTTKRNGIDERTTYFSTAQQSPSSTASSNMAVITPSTSSTFPSSNTGEPTVSHNIESLLGNEDNDETHTKNCSSSTSPLSVVRNKDMIPDNNNSENNDDETVHKLATSISLHTTNLSQHLLAHLEKEETHCMPLVVKHLSKSEIHDLVGQIMGKRSSDTMSQILNMAVQNLSERDREEMVYYMKQAMVGTFFERWLSMTGWTAAQKSNNGVNTAGGSAAVAASVTSPSSFEKLKKDGGTREVKGNAEKVDMKEKNQDLKIAFREDSDGIVCKYERDCKRAKTNDEDRDITINVSGDSIEGGESEVGTAATATSDLESVASTETPLCTMCASAGRCLGAGQRTSSSVASIPRPQCPVAANTTTKPDELEKLIRAIASNPELTPVQKNTTIQGLRDSVWKNNIRLKNQKKRKRVGCCGIEGSVQEDKEEDDNTANAIATDLTVSNIYEAPASATLATRSRRMTPASSYYKKNRDGKIELVWSSDSPPTKFPPDDLSIPLFSASELAPTYHDGATGAVLGCPHYARSCKLRHPSSGRLYTCRLCCQQDREMPMKDQDSPLDRYAVTEVLCMRCGALQPAGDRCINPKCESQGKPYSKYCCNICNFYDDGPQKDIYHCPFCNVCRSGKGLGIDYRHCMRCNACVSLADDAHHCIPQRLQGNCPICHETMFESTEPLRGLKCGHVMHLSCFTMYMRGQSYTCPLCKKSVEDMKEYFALLDAAIRMQPMPAAYSATVSEIYCQDCGKVGKVQYHFVGCKCSYCGSYNTRELGRVEGSSESS